MSLSEKDHQRQVLELADLYDWRHYHTFDSRRSPGGFPDLVLVKQPRLLFVELKTDTGTVTANQQAWLDSLVNCPATATYVWRPRHIDGIAQVLSGVSCEDCYRHAMLPTSCGRCGAYR